MTTKAMKAAVFFKPRTVFITSILGKDKAGPANNSANAGPFPMPLPKRPCRIGTSVSVAKYIKAPEMAAKKLATREFPLTAASI